MNKTYDLLNRIIKLLNSNNRQQKELTDYLGVDKSIFSAWKSGKSNSYKKYLPEIAEFFSVPIDKLVNDIQTDKKKHMNLIKCLDDVLNLDKNMLKESDFFGHLYDVKKYSLMAENHYGKEINRGSIAEVKNRIEQIDSVSTLVLYAKAFAECIRNTIPNDLLHIWENADYDEYTDKYHHRCFWSQIENHAAIDLLLKRFCDINGYETDENCAITANKVWNIRIHDFNNYDIYFSSETEVNAFTSAFDLAPYTVYKYKDKNWEEQYTV